MEIRKHYELVRAVTIRTDGQTMAEYGVLLALVTLAVVSALGMLALAISGRLGSVANDLGSSL